MPEDISIPLLALIKEQGLIDDLQYEEVVAEVKRSGKPMFQILQDFGIMDLDAILQVMANHLGTEVVSLRGPGISAGIAEDHSGQPRRGCINACRWRLTMARCRVALGRSAEPGARG